MLERLVIRNLALVELAEVGFGPGMNAVTGETGAGKTLLVQSANLLVGGRADPDAVREGAKSATVEGVFRLEDETARRVGALLAEWGLEFDGETLIVRRELSAEGRSRATVNQSPVTLASLRRLGEALADLHGQHEHQGLLRAEAGLVILDRLGGLEEARAAYGERLAAWREAAADLDRLRASLATFAERRDYLAAAARELDEAHLAADEDEALRGEAARLAHADRLRALSTEALARLSEDEQSAGASLSAAAHALEQAAALDPGLEGVVASLREAAVATDEAARELSAYASRLESDPDALEAVEARRDLIARLTRKYRRAVPELIAWRAEIGAELEQGDDAEGALGRAAARADETAKGALEAAAALSRLRTAEARTWSRRLARELKPLGFAHAQLDFAVVTAAALPEHLTPAGLDSVEIRFTANPGEGPRPLQKIASGGELSRVALALKTALQGGDRVDLLLFDEVDSGIGGAVAQAVGERLRGLAEHRQIVCVTHLPMIAALASHHLRVSKHVQGGRTVARIERVKGADRVEELARMLAGDRVTDTTRRQARELLATPGGDA